MKTVHFQNPDGEEVEFLLFGQTDWVIVLPVTPDGYVVSIQQYVQGLERVISLLPGGGLGKGELITQAADRELLEETGYQSESVITLGCPVAMTERNSWTRFHPCLALGCRKVQEGTDDDDGPAIVNLIPLKQWVGMANTNMESSGAIIATFRAPPYLAKFLG